MHRKPLVLPASSSEGAKAAPGGSSAREGETAAGSRRRPIEAMRRAPFRGGRRGGRAARQGALHVGQQGCAGDGTLASRPTGSRSRHACGVPHQGADVPGKSTSPSVHTRSGWRSIRGALGGQRARLVQDLHGTTSSHVVQEAPMRTRPRPGSIPAPGQRAGVVATRCSALGGSGRPTRSSRPLRHDVRRRLTPWI